MKKLLVLVSVLLVAFTLTGCQNSTEKLYVLNWGEYMDMDLVYEFEQTFDVDVVYEEVGSNEEMEVKIKSGVTSYDIAIPSEYMVDKLRQQDLLNTIDESKLDALNDVSIKADVQALTNDKEYDPYFVPYFYGTIGIMYNMDTVSENDLTGWDILFSNDHGYKLGMYDSARDALASALLYLNEDVNTADEAILNNAKDALMNTTYEVFGEDNLKGLVQSGNLDLALVYSGDYFDQMYQVEADGGEVNFGYYVPETTNIWVDGFVIPTTSENTDLAHEFINFFLDVDRNVQNADYVGYASTLEEAYAVLASDEYGYEEYENYNPYPAGSNRVLYQFVSEDRFTRLNDILNEVKANQ